MQLQNLSPYSVDRGVQRWQVALDAPDFNKCGAGIAAKCNTALPECIARLLTVHREFQSFGEADLNKVAQNHLI